ncbi:MAG TPA: hypothetical protein VJ732_06710 [Bryobacteraceae bacterium]|nr:hypothetical protein [Bryobacteraceae bacterium]
MNTRSKILAASTALSRPAILVTGYFDLLRAEDARQLADVSNRRPGALLVVAIRGTGELLDTGARAELVAAVRVVDYVLTVHDEDLDGLIERLKPVEVVHLERADLLRTRRLIEDAPRGKAG